MFTWAGWWSPPRNPATPIRSRIRIWKINFRDFHKIYIYIYFFLSIFIDLPLPIDHLNLKWLFGGNESFSDLLIDVLPTDVQSLDFLFESVHVWKYFLNFFPFIFPHQDDDSHWFWCGQRVAWERPCSCSSARWRFVVAEHFISFHFIELLLLPLTFRTMLTSRSWAWWPLNLSRAAGISSNELSVISCALKFNS